MIPESNQIYYSQVEALVKNPESLISPAYKKIEEHEVVSDLPNEDVELLPFLKVTLVDSNSTEIQAFVFDQETQHLLLNQQAPTIYKLNIRTDFKPNTNNVITRSHVVKKVLN
jgi:hypothetical protein